MQHTCATRLFSAFAVWTARRRTARVNSNGWRSGRRWWQSASRVSISHIASRTRTYWVVILDFAICIHPTNTRTWIDTFLRFACLVVRAIVIDHAFRFATNKRISKISGQALARSCFVSHGANCIASTW